MKDKDINADIKGIKKRYRERTGVIAILDFLGISKLGKSETLDYLGKRDEVLDELDSIMKKSNWFYSDYKPSTNPEYYTFGDTLMITWEMAENSNSYFSLLAMSSLLTELLLICLRKNLLIRGAMSFGKYFVNRSRFCIIGNAVSDCASWYEESNWFGIVVTPRTGNLLDTFELAIDNGENFNKKTFSVNYIKYEIPFKDHSKFMWALSWPIAYLAGRISKPDISKIDLYKEIEAFDIIPFGTEDKYYNTKVFIDYCFEYAKKLINK